MESLLGEESVKNLQIPKLILTGYNAESKIFDALKHGATGYMFKEDIYSLGQILEILLSGGAYISPTIAVIVANFLKVKAIYLNIKRHLLKEKKKFFEKLLADTLLLKSQKGYLLVSPRLELTFETFIKS